MSIPGGWTLNTELSLQFHLKHVLSTSKAFHLIKTIGANARNVWTQVTKLLQKNSFTCSFSPIVKPKSILKNNSKMSNNVSLGKYIKTSRSQSSKLLICKKKIIITFKKMRIHSHQCPYLDPVRQPLSLAAVSSRAWPSPEA